MAAALLEVPLSPTIMPSEASVAWNGFESLFFQASQNLVSIADNFFSICAFVMAGFGLGAGEGDAVAVNGNGADTKNGDVKAADALRVLRGEMR